MPEKVGAIHHIKEVFDLPCRQPLLQQLQLAKMDLGLPSSANVYSLCLW